MRILLVALSVLAICSCATQTKTIMTMQNGPSDAIQYTNWDGTQWTASLQNVSAQVNVGGLAMTVIDPDFHHVGFQNQHDDEWIHYIAWDGRHFASKCHSHLDQASGTVTFTFEHFKEPDLDHADHEDDTIGFIAWDGSHWLANAPPVGPLQSSGSLHVKFNLVKH